MREQLENIRALLTLWENSMRLPDWPTLDNGAPIFLVKEQLGPRQSGNDFPVRACAARRRIVQIPAIKRLVLTTYIQQGYPQA